MVRSRPVTVRHNIPQWLVGNDSFAMTHLYALKTVFKNIDAQFSVQLNIICESLPIYNIHVIWAILDGVRASYFYRPWFVYSGAVNFMKKPELCDHGKPFRCWAIDLKHVQHRIKISNAFHPTLNTIWPFWPTIIMSHNVWLIQSLECRRMVSYRGLKDHCKNEWLNGVQLWNRIQIHFWETP